MLISEDSIKIEQGVNFYNFLISKGVIHFPFYQRLYAWGVDQAKNFTDDFLLAVENKRENGNKKLHLSDIVFYIENGEVKVSDGQQRTITLYHFINAINNTVDKMQLSSSIKITPYKIQYDDEDMQKSLNKVDLGKPTQNHKKVIDYLTTFIEDNVDCIEEISEIIKNDISVNAKEVDTFDNAYALFISLNSGGKPLSKKDMISASFKDASKKYGIETIGTYSIDEIQLMLSIYYDYTEEPLPSNFNQSKIMSFVNTRIRDNVTHFTNFTNCLRDNKNVCSHPMAQVFLLLNKKEVLKLFLLLNLAYKDSETYRNREFIKNVFMPLALLSIIWKFKKVNPGGKLRSLLQTLVVAITDRKPARQISEIITRFVHENEDICTMSLEEFITKLGNIDQNTSKAILFMDNILHNTSGSIDVKHMNLEHVFPVNPENEWAQHGWPALSSVDISRFVNNIGNHMLLPEEINKKIQNKYITEKKAEYEQIISSDILLRTDMNTIDFDAFEERKIDYIIERQNNIANSIRNDFPFGTMLLN